MRISDWSSDVCSSDLDLRRPEDMAGGNERGGNAAGQPHGFTIGDRHLTMIGAITQPHDRQSFGCGVNAAMAATRMVAEAGRKSVVEGKRGAVSVDIGGRGMIKKKNNTTEA